MWPLSTSTMVVQTLGWPMIGGVAAAALLVGGLGFHMWTEKIRDEGAAVAHAECSAAVEQESAAAAERLAAATATHDEAARSAQARVIEAERRAAAAHRTLEAERVAHARTRDNQCHAGCSLHLPSGD